MATNVNALVRNLGTEISAAYNPEKSTPTRMVFDYGGKEGLSTKQFMRKLKEIHPKAANAKDSTLGVAISSYLIESGIRESVRYTAEQRANPLNGLEFHGSQVRVPEGVTGLIIRSRDPETEIIWHHATQPFRKED
jgi:hypothetical protein